MQDVASQYAETFRVSTKNNLRQICRNDPGKVTMIRVLEYCFVGSGYILKGTYLILGVNRIYPAYLYEVF